MDSRHRQDMDLRWRQEMDNRHPQEMDNGHRQEMDNRHRQEMDHRYRQDAWRHGEPIKGNYGMHDSYQRPQNQMQNDHYQEGRYNPSPAVYNFSDPMKSNINGMCEDYS